LSRRLIAFTVCMLFLPLMAFAALQPGTYTIPGGSILIVPKPVTPPSACAAPQVLLNGVCTTPTVNSNTGLAMRCDGISVATQAAACTGSRSWVRPGPLDFIESYPSIPVDSTTVTWTDPNLQFRQWSTIPATYGVGICTKNLTAAQQVIPVGGTDQCAPGADAVIKPFVALSSVQTAAPVIPPGATPVTLNWIAPTINTDGSPLTDLTSFRIYEGSSPTTLAPIAVTPAAAATTFVAYVLPGTSYFTVTSIDSTGVESVQSNVVTYTRAS
jgi:hypothetical protein